MRIGSIGGITVRVHATMVLLLGWLLLEHARIQNWGTAAEGLALMICAFVVITLHELGHALMARRFGIRTRDITLLPIGGVSTLEKMPERPREEIAVALAGPAVNIVLAALGFAVLMAAQWVIDVRTLQFVGGPFIGKLVVLNLGLAAFNLVPAFPMDGGRVLRAILATRMERSAATAAAARVGQVLALAMAAVGLLFAPTLVLVALFVWMGAQQELMTVQLTSKLTGLTVADAMVAQFRTLDADTPVSEALELSTTGLQHDFPIRAGGEVVGVLSREGLLETLQLEGSNAPVSMAVRGALTSVEPATPLAQAMDVMRANRANAAVVLDHGKLAGLLTAQSVAERLWSSVARGARS